MSKATTTVGEGVRDNERPAAASFDKARSIVDGLLDVGDDPDRVGELFLLAPEDSLGLLLIGLSAGELRPREGGAWPSHTYFVEGETGIVIKQWMAWVRGA